MPDSYFENYRFAEVGLLVLLAVGNLVLAYALSKLLRLATMASVVLTTLVPGAITAFLWFVLVMPFVAGFAGSYATFAAYEERIQNERPPSTDPEYTNYKDFIERQEFFSSTLGNPGWLLPLFLLDLVILAQSRPGRNPQREAFSLNGSVADGSKESQ